VASDATALLREALALSESDRAGIAAELLASLSGPESALEVDSVEWLREIEERAAGVLSGETPLEDWDTVEQRILGKFSSE
jgi:hypothetical protein